MDSYSPDVDTALVFHHCLLPLLRRLYVENQLHGKARHLSDHIPSLCALSPLTPHIGGCGRL